MSEACAVFRLCLIHVARADEELNSIGFPPIKPLAYDDETNADAHLQRLASPQRHATCFSSMRRVFVAGLRLPRPFQAPARLDTQSLFVNLTVSDDEQHLNLLTTVTCHPDVYDGRQCWDKFLTFLNT